MAKLGGGFWKGFVLVILIEAVILGCLALVVEFGGFPMGADAHAGSIETQLGHWTHDSWVRHHAPHEADPVGVNDQRLMHGAALYQGNCAACHGGENYDHSPLHQGVYPGVPQFMRRVDEHGGHHGGHHRQPSAAQQQAQADHMFFVIKHGIRFTGMPAWDYNMNDNDIWEVVNFMRNMGRLPPDVQQAWRQMPMSPIAATTTPMSMAPVTDALPSGMGKKKQP